MRELDHKEGWTLKNWCFWTVVLEKTLESHLDCKKIKPVNLKWNESWIFIGRTEAEAETPILWPPGVKSRLIRKDSGTGKDWRQEEKRTTEEEMTSPTRGTWVWTSSGRRRRTRGRKSWTWLSDWTELNWTEWDGMPWSYFFECWVLSQLCHSPLSPSSRGSSLSAIRLVSSAYLRWLIFLPAVKHNCKQRQ